MRRKMKIVAVILTAGLMFMGGTKASANLLTNGSFEVASPDGWPGGFNTYTYSQAYYDGPAPDATAYPTRGDIYGWAPNENGVQTYSHQVADLTAYAGQPYTLSAFLAGYLSDYGFIRLTFNDAADGTGSAVGTPIEFDPWGGAAPTNWVGSINASGLVDPTVANTTRNWSYFEISDFVPAGALSAVVDWEGHQGGLIGSGSAGNDAYTDMVSLDVVPEPMTMTLLGLGGLALLRRRR